MSERAFALITRLVSEIQQWPDANILEKVALTTKRGAAEVGIAIRARFPDKIAVETPPPGHTRGHGVGNTAVYLGREESCMQEALGCKLIEIIYASRRNCRSQYGGTHFGLILCWNDRTTQRSGLPSCPLLLAPRLFPPRVGLRLFLRRSEGPHQCGKGTLNANATCSYRS